MLYKTTPFMTKLKAKTCDCTRPGQPDFVSSELNSDMEKSGPMRIVLLGKTGAGKSSLANLIFGEEGKFKESSSPNSETKKCYAQTKNINGRLIHLIDTPGLFDTELNNTELNPEILKCIEESAPGPHAFLLVLKVERYTKQEQEVVENILQSISEEALKYTTVVFTHGDQMDKGVEIKDWVYENRSLRSLVQKCGGRCHVFDNKYWNNSQDPYRNNQVQVTELLRAIEETVKEKNGKHYTNMFLVFVILNIEIIRLNFKLTARVLLGALLGVEGFANALFENAPPTQEETSQSQHVQEAETLRIILMGKAGSGKSSVANTILGHEDTFGVHNSPYPSQTYQSITRRVHGRNILLTDTPGFFYLDLESQDLRPVILKCIEESAPGPHAFLLVLRVERFTIQEQEVVENILQSISEEALKYTTVVFTHGDDLGEGVEIKDWVYENRSLRSLVQRCGGRCHVFDNKYWNNSQDPYRNNQYQVTELLKTIEKTVEENGGRYYTKESTQSRSFFSKILDWIFR